ncbi:MAG: GNAT family N-acetyltransferase [Pseudomonadota bacterium]
MTVDVVQRMEPELRDLIATHLAETAATSPPESVHTLTPAQLLGSTVTLWQATLGERLVGCVALKALASGDGELKSMRTVAAARGRGVGGLLLATVLDEARRRGYATLYLETGPMAYFDAARRLYDRAGFEVCPPFDGYTDDPNSVFMRRSLVPAHHD